MSASTAAARRYDVAAWAVAQDTQNSGRPHLTYSTSEAPHTRALDALMSVKAATSLLPGATMYAQPSARSARACVQFTRRSE